MHLVICGKCKTALSGPHDLGGYLKGKPVCWDCYQKIMKTIKL